METCNIMVDPRVYRGSVAANRRAQQERIRKEIHKEESERRFRANVIRNRLSMGLGRYAGGSTEVHSTKLSRISRLASLAGYERLSKHKALLNNEITKLVPDGIEPSELSKNMAIDKKWTNRSGFAKSRTAFRNVRFVPVDTLTRAKYLMAPDHPTDIRRAVTTPPPTSAGIYGRSDALVQTADSFDEHVQVIVHEMITLTLDSAINSLIEEQRSVQEARKTAKLIDQLNYERKITQKLIEKIDETKNMHAEKIREKDERIREYEKRESAQIAIKMVDQLIDGTIQKAIKSNLVEEIVSVRHVAADTRQLHRKSLKQKLVLAELENDFVPWLLRRVDNTLEHCIASSCLDDAYFCSDRRIRDISKAKVNEKLYGKKWQSAQK